MRFPVYFVRRKGAGFSPLLGSDLIPTERPNATADNILSHKLARPMSRIAVGYAYDGAGVPVALPVSVYVWDDASERWYLADAGTLTAGELIYLRCPVLADPPPTVATLGQPQHGIDAAIVVSDNDPADAPEGTHHIVAGPDAAEWGQP